MAKKVFGEKIGEFIQGNRENGYLAVTREDLERSLSLALRSLGKGHKLVPHECFDKKKGKVVEYYARPPIENWMTAYDVGNAACRDFEGSIDPEEIASEEVGTFSRTQKSRMYSEISSGQPA